MVAVATKRLTKRHNTVHKQIHNIFELSLLISGREIRGKWLKKFQGRGSNRKKNWSAQSNPAEITENICPKGCFRREQSLHTNTLLF
jgi:hypothetical protein